MGRVLVDDDDTIAGLGDDIGAVNLGARGAERAIDQVGAGIYDGGAGIGRRRSGIECRLRAVLEAGRRAIMDRRFIRIVTRMRCRTWSSQSAGKSRDAATWKWRC
jgi:hypothetical protein